jgi:hypothetical protein
MPLDRNRCRPLLQSFDFRNLFIEELGWDGHKAALDVALKEASVRLESISHKRGFVVWQCVSPAGGRFPDSAARRRIEREATKAAHEHLIIFTDAAKTRQVWQWVRREPGKPLRVREIEWNGGQSGEIILQKLDPLFVSIDDEEALTLLDVTGRAGANVDERVTKKFYEEFRKQHGLFLKFITGIPNQGDHEWYASVMLNRLMFVYFVQKKGFLDGDTDYLRNRLTQLKAKNKGDKFYSFYRAFLLRLFHEGLGGKGRKGEIEKLIGRVPYLNGGIFDVHQLERDYGKEIQIPDTAFEAVFDYFDRYQWQLDERPLRNDNEINPDVLGYIFEKYINQKQMGAYYTKEDITEYIGKSCIIPFLFDAAKAKCKVAFENADGPTVWDLLRENPDRYIYPAVRHGCDLDLPKEIAAGLDTKKPDLIERRKPWNKAAPVEYALPTEIWREVVARRQRCEEIRLKLASGEVRDINDFITLNLDLRQFAQDVIGNCEGPDLLMAFWQALSTITVLDPTGGSGAFVFAALSILEPLYEGCLDRMEAFLTEWGESGKKTHPNYYKKFTEVFANVAVHKKNRRYFILKSIILNNLYAVDIMEEAVEICKLRLFLKLAAQVEADPEQDNYGIEPLPDIDFNIRCGNTLVGYATYEEVKAAVTSALDFDNAMERIATKAADLQQTFDTFRKYQTEGDGAVPAADKRELQKRLKALEDELNRHLAGEYGVKISDKVAYNHWIKTHQPFHWFIQFYGILNSGGFDVIIGNPPYVVNTSEKVHYEIREGLFITYSSKNLYAFVFERSLQLGSRHAAIGMIVQMTALSAEKMSSLQNLLLPRGLLVASAFPRRPESIFDGVEMPVTIILSRSGAPKLQTSRVNRFYTEERPSALATMKYAEHNNRLHGHRIAKIGSSVSVGIYQKVEKQKVVLGSLTSPASKNVIYYQEACRYWVKACVGPPFFCRNGERMAPPHGRTLNFRDPGSCAFACCLVNSSLFYWFYSAFSDCEHINDALIRDFRIPALSDPAAWIALESRLAESQKRNARRKTIHTKQGHKIEYDEMDAPKSKSILDEVDTVLAEHYGLTKEELDYIINYDIKYRLGRGAGEEE